MIDPAPEVARPVPDTAATAFEPSERVDWTDLITHPARFFASDLPYKAIDALPFIAWIAGMSSAIDRVDRQMVKAELGMDNAASALGESWLLFWLAVIFMGAVSGLLRWHLGAWWYRVRLRWSGAIDPDHHRARVVYFYASLVWDVPAVALAIIATMMYPDYLASWNAESLGSLLIFIPLVWSFVVSYRGVRAAFDVRRGAARFWFLIAPLTMMAVMFGVVGALYAAVGG